MSGGLLVCIATRFERMDDQGEIVATDEPYAHVLCKHKGEWLLDGIFSQDDQQSALRRAQSLAVGAVRPGEKLPDGLVWASWLS